jgi:hypothetical protein
MRNTRNTAIGKIVLSLVLVLAFLILISGVSACSSRCDTDYKANSCSSCYEAVYPNGASIGSNSFGVFTLPHTMYNVSYIAVTWGDAHMGCKGRIETSSVNSVWQDIAAKEKQNFYFSTSSKINLTSVKIAVAPKSGCATCNFARVYKIEVWGKCGGTCYNCSNGNQTNQTNTTDNIAPIVNINSPIANQVYNYSSILFNFNATDNGTIDKMWYNLSGVSGFYNGAFGSNLSEGNYSLTVYANDSAGNTGSNSLFFSINLSSGNSGNQTNQTNATVPLIYINSPHNFSGNSSAFVINATSDQNIVSWSYSLNGGSLTTFIPSFTVLYAINGTNSLFVSGANTNGIGNASTAFFYNYSNQDNGLNQTNISAPVISNITTDPILPAVNNGTNETIVVNFSSNVYPIVVIFKLLNSSSVLVNNQSYTLLNSASLPINYVIPTNLPNGVYYLWLNATNALGNSSEYLVGSFSVNSGNNGGDNGDDGNHNGGGNSRGNDRDGTISFSDSGESISLDYSYGNETSGFLLSGSSNKTDSCWLTISMILVILCLIVFLLIVLLKRN